MFALANIIKNKTSFNIFIKITIAIMTVTFYFTLVELYNIIGVFDTITTGMFLADMFL